MDLGYIYNLISYISNKHEQGYLSPIEFQNSANIAQKQYQQSLINQLQGIGVSSGRGIRNINANNQPVIQKLSPFVVKVNGASVAGDGTLAKPHGIEHLLAMRTPDDKNRIWRVEDDRIYSHASSTIDPPTSSPYYTEYDDHYTINPVSIGSINWSYIKTAPDVVYATTNDSNGRPIYSPGASVQFLWGDLEMTEIIIRILFMLGISIQAAQLSQYYGEIKNGGQ